jgi:predicted porin
MKSKFTLLAAGLLAMAGAAHATDLNYDYVEAGYSVIDFDDFNEDLKSVHVNGSFLVADEVYLFAGYSDGQTDRFAGGRLGLTNYTLGAGYRFGVGPQTDFNFAAAFERARIEGKGGLAFLGSDSENGYSLSVGVRHLVVPEFEVAADVTYVNIDEDDTVLTLGGLWHMTDLVAVGLAYGVGSDAQGFAGWVRFKF